MSGRHEWLNQDPIQENGGINLYGFVGNDPVDDVDPTGLLDYYYSSGGFFQPSGPVPYLEGDSTAGNIGADVYNTIPVAYNALFGWASDIGTAEGTASGNGDIKGMVASAGMDAMGFVPGDGAAARALTKCESQLAKRRLGKELGNVPRSAQPINQGRYGKGTKWWEYTDSKGNAKIVVEHPDGTVHVGTPKPQSEHAQGGPPKYYPVPGSGHVGE